MLSAIIIVVAVILDQFTKYLVVQNIPLRGSVPFIDGFMKFYYTRNTGAAWSIMDGSGWERAILLTVSLIAMGAMLFMLIKYYRRHILLTISLSAVFGGALGNMIDRIALGYVVDFLSTEFIEFPTFNIADSFITIGAVLMAVYIIFFDAKAEAKIKAEQAEQTQKPENSSEENSDNG